MSDGADVGGCEGNAGLDAGHRTGAGSPPPRRSRSIDHVAAGGWCATDRPTSLAEATATAYRSPAGRRNVRAEVQASRMPGWVGASACMGEGVGDGVGRDVGIGARPQLGDRSRQHVGGMVNDVRMSLFVRTFALGAVAALRAGHVASSGDNSTDSTADPGCLTDEDLVTALRAAEALGRRIDGLRAHLAAEAAERSRRELGAGGLARRLGCRTHVELVQRVTGAAAATVNRRVRLGQAIRPARRLSGETGPAQFPAVAAAVAAATLGTDAALAVVDALRPTLRVAGAADVAAAEQAIVAEAACPAPGAPPALDADSVRLQGQVWATVLDPDGAEPREADMQRRGLWLLAPRHGLIPVRGNLLPDVAAALRTYADACTSPRTADLPSPGTPAERPSPGVTAEHVPPDERQDRATALPDGGRESLADGHPAHLPETRSKAHQMHDVLASVLGVAARVADAPSLAGNAPTLVIAVRADDVGDTCGTIRAGTPAGAAFAEGCSQPVGLAAARHTGCAGAGRRLRHPWLPRPGGLVRDAPRDHPRRRSHRYAHRQRRPALLVPPPHHRHLGLAHPHGRGHAGGPGAPLARPRGHLAPGPRLTRQDAGAG